MSPHRFALCILAVMAVALAVRLLNLGQEPLWADEFYSVMIASHPTAADVIQHVAEREPHPPLHFLFLHFWMRLFGDGDVAARMPSALFGAAAVALFIPLAFAIWPGAWRRALLAGGLAAVSPFLVWYSQEVRPYAGLVACEVLALWAFIAADRSPHRPAPFVIGVAAVFLAIGQHFYGLFLWAWAVAVLVLAVWRGPRTRAALVALGVTVLGAIPFLVWAARDSIRITWLQRTELGHLVEFLNAQVNGPLHPALPVIPSVITMAIVGVALLASLVMTVNRIRWGTARPGELPLLLAFGALFVGPAVISFFMPILWYGQRYMIIGVPTVLLVLLSGLEVRRLRLLVLVASATLLVSAAAYLVEINRHRQHRLWDVVAETIDARAQPGDAVVVLPPRVGPLLQRYMETNPPILPESAAQDSQGPERLWCVAFSDQRRPLAAAGAYDTLNIGLFESHTPGQVLFLHELQRREP